MIRVLVTAPRGKMGRLIVKAAAESDDLTVVAALGPKGRDYIGRDAGLVSGLGRELSAPVVDDLEEMIGNQSAIEGSDVIVDFSTVESSMGVLEAARRRRKPLVCGGTGFSTEQEKAFARAAADIPILKAANTSYVVNVMSKLVERAAAALKGRCQVDIIDLHDKDKADAPSGTAGEFAQAICAASGRPASEVAFHSLRSGDIPSSHTVIFGCMGERLEITHHAYNFECYALGALAGARFLANQPAGLYTMEDVAGLG